MSTSVEKEALPDYSFGEILGKGAFGSVYRALCWTTGETVAIKQISLGRFSKAELPEVLAEIDLLKALNHPAIVQYRGFVKTEHSLYIILEYCENGSLYTTCKKFGLFTERLVAVYVAQVLDGLLYLHEQGVIHRDIKASNILANKDGKAKLADFGVATRVGGSMQSSVVGSPYWMAPEVIDQTGASTASDIWSLGCVVVELLTGKPPYWNLDPLPAMFRIVSDDAPPLPDGLSHAAIDFLMQCFRKDPNIRVDAKRLLRHSWLAQSNASAGARAKAVATAAVPVSTLSRREPSSQVAQILGSRIRATSKTAAALPPSAPIKSLSKHHDADSGDWNADFENGPSAALPLLSPLARSARPRPKASQSDANMKRNDKAIEDYSGILSDSEADPFAGKIRKFKLKQKAGAKPVLHPRDILPPATSEQPVRTPILAISKFVESADDDFSDLGQPPTDLSDASRANSLQLHERSSGRVWLSASDLDDDEDVFADLEDGASEVDTATLANERDDARVNALVSMLGDALSNSEHSACRQSCTSLIDLFAANPQSREHFIKSHGLLYALEGISRLQDTSLIALLLRLINTIVSDDQAVFASFCHLGACSKILPLSSSRQVDELRQEAAIFVSAMCQSSSSAVISALVASGGMRCLVEMLGAAGSESKDIAWLAVDGLHRILHQQTSTYRRDLCQILAFEGIFESLAQVLETCQTDATLFAFNARRQTLEMLQTFSLCDTRLKTSMIEPRLLTALTNALDSLPAADILPALKTMQNISAIPTSLDLLQAAGACDKLVAILGRSSKAQHPPQGVAGPIINSLYNLCRLSVARQEEAAVAGIIPLLQNVVASRSPLRQFAIPVLCDFAHTSARCRSLLGQHSTLATYLTLLSDSYWARQAMESIATWLREDTKPVQKALLADDALEKLVISFSDKAGPYESLIEPLHRVMRISAALTLRLFSRGRFSRAVCLRLSEHRRAVVRLGMLRLVRTACESCLEEQHPPAPLLEMHGVIQRIASDDPAVLVKQLAAQVRKDLKRLRQKAQDQSQDGRVLRRAEGPRRQLSDSREHRHLR
ncbi:uncharacterized protein L969DRAFT_83831 [Mixia osmundae IAM 14324]|uniref:Protein kinase domain-containing protein n=1 Tax=Mixia osmundae (strain CBS 9802 / IAM 14324 / JCM 22182 / KY 12970) TaxID=764103 RepID=G7E3X1_MIXOS|nr:uncharacterized protein L969DRAFT_83831 [Mixia osmundae IAM 14324]KEI41976.1 hypothetical protein L969DRAFT_83831 [Mixia osmundae IAM 14324]GAA97531.1 hypothetical protein E5Q_04209 [Mixia osmundae IAM 14324]